MTIPKDPIILYSYLNTQLRDNYSSLDKLCDDMELDKEEILSKMKAVNYEYNSEKNCFE